MNAPTCARPSVTRSEGHTLKYCSDCNKNSRTRQRTVAFWGYENQLNDKQLALIRSPRFNYDNSLCRMPIVDHFAQILPEYYFCRVISTCVTCDTRRNTEVVEEYYRQFNRFRLLMFKLAHRLGWLHFFPQPRE